MECRVQSFRGPRPLILVEQTGDTHFAGADSQDVDLRVCQRLEKQSHVGRVAQDAGADDFYLRQMLYRFDARGS